MALADAIQVDTAESQPVVVTLGASLVESARMLARLDTGPVVVMDRSGIQAQQAALEPRGWVQNGASARWCGLSVA